MPRDTENDSRVPGYRLAQAALRFPTEITIANK